jgi:hypothetical protein
LSSEDRPPDRRGSASQRESGLDIRPLSANIGDVDRAGQLSAQECIAHSDANVYGDVSLRFRSGGSDMRGKQDIRQQSEWMVSGKWLLLVCVYHGAEEMFVVESFEQGPFVDYSTSRHVDND